MLLFSIRIHRIYAPLSVLQIRVVTFDSCNPVQKSVAMVMVTVVRNSVRPRFDQSEYRATIDEMHPIGVVIQQVKAVDADEVNSPVLLTFCSGKQSSHLIFLYLPPSINYIYFCGPFFFLHLTHRCPAAMMHFIHY